MHGYRHLDCVKSFNNALCKCDLFKNRCYAEGGSAVSERWVYLNTQSGNHNDGTLNDRARENVLVRRYNLDCCPLDLPGAYGNGCFQFEDNGLGRTGTITLADNNL